MMQIDFDPETKTHMFIASELSISSTESNIKTGIQLEMRSNNENVNIYENRTFQEEDLYRGGFKRALNLNFPSRSLPRLSGIFYSS